MSQTDQTDDLRKSPMADGEYPQHGRADTHEPVIAPRSRRGLARERRELVWAFLTLMASGRRGGTI
jgi:hypothetical protein